MTLDLLDVDDCTDVLFVDMEFDEDFAAAAAAAADDDDDDDAPALSFWLLPPILKWDFTYRLSKKCILITLQILCKYQMFKCVMVEIYQWGEK